MATATISPSTETIETKEPGLRDRILPGDGGGSAKAIAGIEALGSLGFGLVEVVAPRLFGKPLNASSKEMRALGTRDLVLGAMLLVSPWRKWVLLARAISDASDAIRYGRRNKPTLVVAGGSVVMALAGILLGRRR